MIAILYFLAVFIKLTLFLAILVEPHKVTICVKLQNQFLSGCPYISMAQIPVSHLGTRSMSDYFWQTLGLREEDI